MALGQLDGEVSAQSVGVVQLLEVQLVELCLAVGQIGDMLLPAMGTLAVAGDAHGVENGVPELGHGLILAHIGKDTLCPGGDGDGGDAPGEAAGHLQAVEILQRLAAGALGADQTVRVHALQVFRVLRRNGQIRRPLTGIVIEKAAAPFGDFVEHGLVRPEKFLPAQDVVVPVHHHFTAAHIVGSRGAQPGKMGTLHRGGDDQRLAALDIQTHLNEKRRVFPQFFFHWLSSLSIVPFYYISCSRGKTQENCVKPSKLSWSPPLPLFRSSVYFFHNSPILVFD